MNSHEYLNSFSNFETSIQANGEVKEFDLTRIVELLDLLGNPQKNMKIIHVAGTKGKGSTCAFLSHILAASGARVGLYTSPHLHLVNERIRVLDAGVFNSNDDFYGMITDEQLDRSVNALRPHIAAIINRGSTLTYFEVLTAAALYFFSQQNLDWLVLETGLGGRLDATNAVDSQIAVITSISLDHTHILGDTLIKIAGEKAGIIKNSRQRVVIAPQPDDVRNVFLNRCREFGIPPIVVGLDNLYTGAVSLKGTHQKINASTALAVIGLLKIWGHKISDANIAQGLSSTRWPARFERVHKDPDIILDAAHNDASSEVLSKTIAVEYPKKKVILILGFSTDKDIPAVVNGLKDLASFVILTQAQHPRAHVFTSSEAKTLFRAQEYSITKNIDDAIDEAISKAGKTGVIVVAGSIFIVAEVRDKLRHVSV